ncbi:HAD-IA family hydrolase [Marinilongibacter aquaticus]|uniref:HAD family hydrolase n=1 Tax=Marinilongibacter aquaticus TaxID=2975157 RepID=UPI0021BCFEFD|nr:HAD-IA family hydrolase [Marinilongibacter aquaticus]UBM60306.1 HAD-IA family hydrolase [Marinilongibacter aquaticus]
MMPSFEAVIFDMDGVLVDSEPFWQKAENEVFSRLGVQLEDSLCAQTKYMTTREVTAFWFERNPWKSKSFSEVEKAVIDTVIQLIRKEDCEISGVVHFIRKLKSSGFKLALATNSPFIIIPEVLKKLNLEGIFDAVSSAEFEEQGKPHPAIYSNTAKKLAIRPDRCLVIEDSNSGIRAAQSAGMPVAGFMHSGLNATLQQADYLIHHFSKEGIPFLHQSASLELFHTQ